MASALIVDSDNRAYQILAGILSRFSLETRRVHSAAEVVAAVAESLPDIIFMDSIVPGSGGFDAVKKLKSTPDTASIPVVMYTSGGNDVYFGQARAMGAADVLVKHADEKALADMFKRFRDRGIADIPVSDPVNTPIEVSGTPAIQEAPRVGRSVWLMLLAVSVMLTMLFQSGTLHRNNALLMDSMLWAFNEATYYDYGETPLNELQQERLLTLLDRLRQTEYTGRVLITEYAGIFCQQRLVRGRDDVWVLAADTRSLAECERIAAAPSMDASLTARARARFRQRIAAAGVPSRIQVQIRDAGQAAPLRYPDRDPLLRAGLWNDVARRNNRVIVELLE